MTKEVEGKTYYWCSKCEFWCEKHGDEHPTDKHIDNFKPGNKKPGSNLAAISEAATPTMESNVATSGNTNHTPKTHQANVEPGWTPPSYVDVDEDYIPIGMGYLGFCQPCESNDDYPKESGSWNP